MTKLLRISSKAEEDLRRIEDRIAADNPHAAFEFIEATTETFSQIARWPESGRALHRKAYRITCVSRFNQYLVICKVSKEWVEISRVFRGSLDLYRMFPDDGRSEEE
jgi:plasmid stabilization system protein ParE